jgi:hypothetical protein
MPEWPKGPARREAPGGLTFLAEALRNAHSLGQGKI